MFALGILAILHTLFLPGYLVLRGLRLTGTGALRTLILAVPISLLINHQIVYALTAAGLMDRWAMLGLISAEAVLALLLWARSDHPGRGWAADIARWRELIPALGARRPWVALASFAAVLASLWMLGVWTIRAVDTWGSIFTHWDAVVSWNRWALSWAEGNLPEITWFYPQILPTAYATTYIVIGTTEVQFFALAIASVLPVVMLLAAVELGLRLREARYMAGAVLLGWVLWTLLRASSLAGYADAPVAAMTFIAVCALVAASKTEGSGERTSLLIAGALAAAAAALTKQAGWLIAGGFPILALILATEGGWMKRVRFALLLVVLIAAMVAPWYIYRVLVPAGREFDYLLGGIHGDRGYLERAARGIDLIVQAGIPRWALYVVPAALLASLLDRTWRWITLLFTAPMIAVWLLFFTYDVRNSAAAFGPMSLGIAVGIACVLSVVGRTVARAEGAGVPARALQVVVAALLAAAVLALSTGEFSEARLRRKHDQQYTEVGFPHISRALLRYHHDHGFHGAVVTNYQPMGFIPALRHHYIRDPLSDERYYRRTLAGAAARPRYVFHFGNRLPDFLEGDVGKGVLRVLENGSKHRPGYTLLEIVEPAP